MSDYQALAVPTLILLAIVGGALVGWALRRHGDTWGAGFAAGFQDGRWTRDNPDPSDSAGA